MTGAFSFIWGRLSIERLSAPKEACSCLAMAASASSLEKGTKKGSAEGANVKAGTGSRFYFLLFSVTPDGRRKTQFSSIFFLKLHICILLPYTLLFFLSSIFVQGVHLIAGFPTFFFFFLQSCFALLGFLKEAFVWPGSCN